MATVISAPTTVTEDGFEVTQRASIQVYQPLYQPGMPTMTVQQRRAASIGWAGIRVDLNAALAGHGLDDSRAEEHTSALQSLMRISYVVCCLKNKHVRHTTDQRECKCR